MIVTKAVRIVDRGSEKAILADLAEGSFRVAFVLRRDGVAQLIRRIVENQLTSDPMGLLLDQDDCRALGLLFLQAGRMLGEMEAAG